MMMPGGDLIKRVLARSRVPGGRRRQEIIRELSAHLEDSADALRVAGHDEEAIERILEQRFGEADAVARDFAAVYWRERLVRSAVSIVALFVAAMLGATLVIGGVQSLAAIWMAHPLRAALTIPTPELIGIAAIAVGYCSPFLAERLGVRPAVQALGLITAVGIGVAVYAIAKPPAAAEMPAIAFVSAACARLLQRVDIPVLWLAGTALPLLVAWSILGPIVDIGLPGARVFPWPMWLGITGVCLVLRPIVRFFEGRVFDAGLSRRPSC